MHSLNAIHFSTKHLCSGYVDPLQQAAVQCLVYSLLSSRHCSAMFSVCFRDMRVKAPEETTEPGLKEWPTLITKDMTDSSQTGELWGTHYHRARELCSGKAVSRRSVVWWQEDGHKVTAHHLYHCSSFTPGRGRTACIYKDTEKEGKNQQALPKIYGSRSKQDFEGKIIIVDS